MSNTGYVDERTLRPGHSQTVNCLAFSSDGRYLASGGDDAFLIIWTVEDGCLLYRLQFESAIDSVIWHPVHPETVIVGCEDGTIVQLRGFTINGHERYDVKLGVRGAVHCLEYDPNFHCLAAALGPEVHVAKEEEKGRYLGSLSYPAPPAPPLIPEGSNEQRDTRLRVVGIHFSKSGRVLIVSYVAHGIIAWNVLERTRLWHLAAPDSAPTMASSALSPDGKHLIVYHLNKHLRLYALGGMRSQVMRHKYEFNVQQTSRHALQVSYIHGGKAIVCGTTTGTVCLWDVETGEIFQKLSHDKDVVQAVAAGRRGPYNYIATGTAGMGQRTYITLWRARINSVSNDVASPEGPIAEAFDALTSNRYFSFEDDLRRAILLIILLLVTLSVIWGAYMLAIFVPWKTFSLRLLAFVFTVGRLGVAATRIGVSYVSGLLTYLWVQVKVSIAVTLRNWMNDPDVRRVLEL